MTAGGRWWEDKLQKKIRWLKKTSEEFQGQLTIRISTFIPQNMKDGMIYRC